MALFYSLPSSPLKRTLSRNPSSFIIEDDFEFETSKKFRLDSLELEKTLAIIQQKHDNQTPKVIAPELFNKGVVTTPSPLKLPPGRAPATTSNSSPYSSFSAIGHHPSCLGTVGGSQWKQHTWKDGYDPFAAAIQKIVKEEVNKEETSDNAGNPEQKTRHRRAHSLWLPPRLILSHAPQIGSKSSAKERKHERTEPEGHNPNLLRPKSNHETGGVHNHPSPSSPDLTLNNQKGVAPGPDGLNWRVTSRKQKMGKFLRRYATFKNEKSEGKMIKDQIASLWKSSSFKRLSLKFKETKHDNQDQKKVGEETKMATTPNHQPKFTTCLGVGAGNASPE